MAARLATTAYALFAYLAFLVSVVWAISFLADALFARTVDTGPSSSWSAAAAIDLGLLTLFAMQHSVMARAFCKRWLTRLVPASAMRSAYVLLASGILIAIFWFWQPITSSVWEVQASVGRVLIFTVYAAGWALVIGSTFMIDHFELFGLRQAYAAVTRQDMTSAPFKAAWGYAWVRHPMMLGLIIVFWATPHMSAGHLLFAVAATAYILLGIAFEERDLRTNLGAPYREYAQRVPALIPRAWRSFGRADLVGRAVAEPVAHDPALPSVINLEV